MGVLIADSLSILLYVLLTLSIYFQISTSVLEELITVTAMPTVSTLEAASSVSVGLDIKEMAGSV